MWGAAHSHSLPNQFCWSVAAQVVQAHAHFSLPWTQQTLLVRGEGSVTVLMSAARENQISFHAAKSNPHHNPTLPHFVPPSSISRAARQKPSSSFGIHPGRRRTIQQKPLLTVFRLADNHFPDGNDDPSFAKYSCLESWRVLAAGRPSARGKLSVYQVSSLKHRFEDWFGKVFQLVRMRRQNDSFLKVLKEDLGFSLRSQSMWWRLSPATTTPNLISIFEKLTKI